MKIAFIKEGKVTRRSVLETRKELEKQIQNNQDINVRMFEEMHYLLHNIDNKFIMLAKHMTKTTEDSIEFPEEGPMRKTFCDTTACD